MHERKNKLIQIFLAYFIERNMFCDEKDSLGKE